MRRHLLLGLSLVLFAGTPVLHASAQSRRDPDDQKRQAQDEEDKKKKQKDKDWAIGSAPLPKVKNAGPCPFAKVLYDASRYVELKDGREQAVAAGYTGEIQQVRAICEYKGSEPIRVQLAVTFAFGRGPQAVEPTKVYNYWVAVTTRNQAVIDKQDFALGIRFPAGADRLYTSDQLQRIVIPRANAQVSGSNFEILVGFVVSPQMAAFNRVGKRFRVNAGGATTTASTAGTPSTR